MKRTFVALSNTFKDKRFATLLKFATVTHVEKSYENPLVCKKSHANFSEKVNSWVKDHNVNVLNIQVDQGSSKHHDNYYVAYITYTTSFKIVDHPDPFCWADDNSIPRTFGGSL